MFFPGEFHAQGILVGYSPWGHREPDMTEGLTVTNKLLGMGDGALAQSPISSHQLVSELFGQGLGGRMKKNSTEVRCLSIRCRPFLPRFLPNWKKYEKPFSGNAC